MSKDHESNHIANTKLQLNHIAFASKWKLQNHLSIIYQLKDSYRIKLQETNYLHKELNKEIVYTRKSLGFSASNNATQIILP